MTGSSTPPAPAWLRIRGASEHNLRRVDVDIPHDRLVVVTGVSGSGKSSLVFDVVFQEARRLYFESFSASARQWMGRLRRPEVEKIEGLRPAVAVRPRSSGGSVRSTVGTMTEIYDWLRLLYARLGQAPPGPVPDRALFSFNSPSGACPACQGLGVVDRIDPELLVADPDKTLRQGALALTTPNGYIIYSQVTMDVLDLVCRAHGFSVDTPWSDLSDANRRIVFEGSDRIRIPYGKHPLASRLRWKGITPKPREEGVYKGILPIMETILKSKRNDNILRYARTLPCRECGGERLNPRARSVLFRGRSISALCRDTLADCRAFFESLEFLPKEAPAGEEIRRAVLARIEILLRLGLGYLTLDRSSTTLSGGETQRIRLAAQAGNGLRGMLYVFDEPTAGLHPAEAGLLLDVLRHLRDQGNTVLIVEHDEAAWRAADHLIDLGPGPGPEGGRVLWSGPPSGLAALPPGTNTTRDHLYVDSGSLPARPRRKGSGSVIVAGARLNNLRGIRAEFKLGTFNVVTGVSGSGKKTLVRHILAARLASGLHGPGPDADALIVEGRIGKVVEIDQSPIGRTPRSNPATYTGISDHIRDLFADLPEARTRGWGRGRFSFNTSGGRCEHCQGAGLLQVGMHFLGDVDIPCPVCEGRRFNAETLEVRFRGLDIHAVLELDVDEAALVFAAEPRLRKKLETLSGLGLGYVKLGQSSTTLSGGEAQRVKLAAELMRSEADDTLIILEEPTGGLHPHDIENLLGALHKLVDRGRTIVAIENHPGFVRAADHVIDLGPGGGGEGGRIVAMGTPEEIAAADSFTGRALRGEPFGYPLDSAPPSRGISGPPSQDRDAPLQLRGVTTHNLHSLDVDFPFRHLTVVSGPSGSGKSSLVFDTLYAESRRRFLESFSPYVRSHLDKGGRADFDSAWGLTPPIAIGSRSGGQHPRSTVGTMTGILDDFRLLFARAGTLPPGAAGPFWASHFSFNHEKGACPRCKGLGRLTVCDPEALVTDAAKPFIGGALDGTKTGRFYGDPHGQHVAALLAAGQAEDVDFSRPAASLGAEARRLALYGSGDRIYDIVWSYKRGARAGDFRFRGPWKGFARLVEEEYERKHADHRGEAMRSLMTERTCPDCGGGRLKPESLAVTLLGRDIAALTAWTIREAFDFFDAESRFEPLGARERAAAEALRPDIVRRLRLVREVGLDYLTLDRRSSEISGGESQRLRLASLLGSRLTGLTFILDEPTLGLHPRDTARMLGLLRGLVWEGNTVVVVEHELQVIEEADWIIDLGPGAGPLGGRIVARGIPSEIRSNPESPTGRALNAPFFLDPLPRPDVGDSIRVEGARAHNLRGIDVSFPAGTLTAVTGVSGSGKTSLVFDVLFRSARAGRPVGCDAVRGLDRYAKIVLVDQEPLAAGFGATILTFAGLFDNVRALFAASNEARSLGLKKAHFSYVTSEGRCPDCRGSGALRVSMDFLADIETPCPTCAGLRYRPDVLRARWRGRTIADVLSLSVEDGAAVFEEYRGLRQALTVLTETGLGYLLLGQPLDTLSGGEGQRLKLAGELVKPVRGRALYLFDEPTAGLHREDTEKLLALFGRLASQGHTLIVVEHDLDVIARAGWIIDLGPEGGIDGGGLVACGAPAQIAIHPDSRTGFVLRARLKRPRP
jgi:excinuclease ABC subunit A